MMGLAIGSAVGLGIWLVVANLSVQPIRNLFKADSRTAEVPLSLLGLSIGLLLLGSFLFGAVLAVLFYWLSGVVERQRQLQKQQEFGLRESLMIPNLVESLAISLTAGLPIVQAFATSLEKAPAELRQIWTSVAAGGASETFTQRLQQVSLRWPFSESARLADQIVIATERGTAMLPMLDSFASDIRSNNQRKLLEKAAQKEVWMMIPVVFGILPAVTAVAVFPALTTLSQL
jgi:tight adherence protein C